MNEISLLDGVLSAALVFHHFEADRGNRGRGEAGMSAMDLSRRAFIKAQAAAAAAAAANVSLPASAQNLPAGPDIQLQWSKAPCRFCGTGCGVMVGVKDGKVVATHGDMQAEVNRGLNCVKGYFLSKIMYGADRLTQPLMRMKERAVRQGRRVPAGLVGPGLRRDGAAVEARAEGERARTRSACSARASGRSSRATPPRS